jgi:DNA-directed DNA polymerase III PolC
MASCCALLRLQSNYSLLWGASPIGDLLDRAAALGWGTVTLADTDNLYAAVPFAREARARGLRPLLGVTIEHGSGSGVLLARDLEGYRSLCRIVSRRRLDPGFCFAPAVAESAAGLHVLVADPRQAEALAPRIDRGRLWFALEHPARWGRVRETAARYGIRPVAAEPVVFAHPADHGRHRVLRAISLGTTVSRLGAGDTAPVDACLHEPRVLEARWRDVPEALRNTEAIAADCRLEMPGGRWVFPRDAGDGRDSARRLRAVCEEGIRRRGGQPSVSVRERLDHELGVIDTLGFTDYFLVVADIVRFAANRGIPTVGRGSGAGSLVAYLLGITHVDPIRYGLCFERFLHEARDDCPDLDIDFCWRGRDEVIEYVYRRYGEDRVAMISTHVLFQSRAALGEAAKAFGLSPEEATVLVRRSRRTAPAACGGEVLAQVLRAAREIEGFPRHVGIHPGGLVVADTRLDDYVSRERAAKGVVVTQPDMHGVEGLGLVKMDLLGNRALSTIRETVGHVTASGAAVGLDPVPDGDGPTGDLLAAGDTLGCFQIESPGMRSLLARIGVRSVDGTIAALSLIRPGPAGSGMKDAYVRRATGVETAASPDPWAEGLLADTHGVMLYEEDVMRMVHAVTGVSLSEADVLRRALVAARSPEDVDSLGRGFVRAGTARGIRQEQAEEAWARVRRFTAYSFCKAHAAGYGVLAYQSAFLKAHHPVEFAVALMNNHRGMYPKWVHLEDARRHGVVIRGPCLLASGVEFRVEAGCLRVGLGQVRALGRRASEDIVRAREQWGPFESLADLRERVALTAPEVEALILAGALDFTGRAAPELLWELRAADRPTPRPAGSSQPGFFHGREGHLRLGLREFPPSRRARFEFEALGISPSGHPLGWVLAELGWRGLAGRDRPAVAAGANLRAVGLLSASRTVETRGGERMAFVTLDDEEGSLECVLFPDAYRRDGRFLDGWGPYEVEGTTGEDTGVATVTVDRLRRLRHAGSALIL